MVTRTLPGSARLPWGVAVALITLAASPVVLRYLVFWPLDQWQVDVEVYRLAGESVLTGRPVYLALTEAPQLLPFTYPPFAALLAIPLALVPFGVVGWVWTFAQVVADVAIVRYAAGPLLERVGRWWPVALALLVAPVLWLHPVSDGIRFGQVNAFLVLLCLLDLLPQRPRWLRRIPVGVLIGVAVAIKLTPGVFVVHLLLCRRWRAAAAAIGTAVVATLVTWVVLPQASFAFWGGALLDPSRLGPNAGTSNQSIRGVLLRLGPSGSAGSLLWLALAAVVAVAGFALARRFWREGEVAAEVGTLGLIAVLVSPVAWIHHYHWMVPVILALLGATPGRDRARWWAAGLMTAWFLARLPWWGIRWRGAGGPDWLTLPMQNADALGGILALVLLWWIVGRRRAGP